VNAAASPGTGLLDVHRFVAEVRLLSYVVAGVFDNTMSHGEAWHFYQLGRRLERSDNTSRLLDVKYFLLLPSPDDVGGAIDELQWTILLRSATALEMYRKRHHQINPERVIDFLLLDTEFPRAILFCLNAADDSLRTIHGNQTARYRNRPERLLGQLRSDLAYAQVYDIIATGLHEYLDNLQSRLISISEAITETFFTLQPPGARDNGAGGGATGDVLFGHQSQGRPGRDRGHTRDHRQ
jgi:uncharacterized alpha-E superfamily protein